MFNNKERLLYYSSMPRPLKIEYKGAFQHVMSRALSVEPVVLEIKDEAQSFGVAPCPACGENHWHFVGLIVRWHWQPG